MKLIFLITLTLGVVGGILFITFLSRTGQPQEDTMQTNQNQQGQEQKEPGDLQIEDLVVGTGAEAQIGNTLSVHYKGTLLNGTMFDSSYNRGTPFQFPLGMGRVIQGWDQGVKGMKVGGKRKLVIPPDLAYGTAGVPGAIPPNSTLVFEVELLDVK